MVLPTAGNYIRFSDIQTEFGGTNPINLSEYYSSGTYTTGVSGIPSSGPIYLSMFAGTANPGSGPVVTPVNLVQNSTFTSTSSWTSATGWGPTDQNSVLYSSSRPTIQSNDPTYTNYLVFSYPSSGQSVSQTISLTSPKSSYTFSFDVCTIMNVSKIDKYYAYASFKNASNTEIERIGILTNTDINWTTWQRQTFTTSLSMLNATSVTIVLSGYDVGFWNGNHGPKFTNVTLE